jgi:hypothetical protein
MKLFNEIHSYNKAVLRYYKYCPTKSMRLHSVSPSREVGLGSSLRS